MLNNFAPERCVLCDKILYGRCRVDAWGRKFCMEHSVDLCSNCGRITGVNDLHLADGRHICNDCIDKVVRKPEHVEWVYVRIRDIFAKNFLALPDKIPIEVVTATKMAELAAKRLGDASRLPFGLASSGGSGIFGTKMNHQVYMLDYQHKVNFGGVLAHELLHIWQSEHHIKLQSRYAEGFCNLGTYLFYNFINTDYTEKLIQSMMANPDPIYGDGFREVKSIFESAGCNNLEKTIEILVQKDRR